MTESLLVRAALRARIRKQQAAARAALQASGDDVSDEDEAGGAQDAGAKRPGNRPGMNAAKRGRRAFLF